MKRVVIESPYAGDVEANIAYAKLCVKDCLARGEAPYASHLFFTQYGILNDDVPEERKLGIEAGFAWRDQAQIIAFYLDRGVSRGMIEALKRCDGPFHQIHFRCLTRSVTLADIELFYR